MQIIDNPKAERVRHVAELLVRKQRERSGKFLIEGLQAVREAVQWKSQAIQDVYVQADTNAYMLRAATDSLTAIMESADRAGIYVHFVTPAVITRISSDAQGIVAVGKIEELSTVPSDIPPQAYAKYAVFWQVRDPGNAGAVIRAADAAGCQAVIFVDDCVEIFNPKVIRSTAGSLFHLPVLTMRTEEFFAWSAQQHVSVSAADVYGTTDNPPQQLPEFLAEHSEELTSQSILFGNEARGLPKEILEQCDHIVSIPMYGKAESLNLATSAAVILFSLAMSSHIGTM